MYVTRPISGLRKFPDTLPFTPPEGPNSGVLVIQDEEAEVEATCCFGLCKDRKIRELPVPQNKMITVCYTTSNGQNSITYTDYVYLIPVLDQPLTSNRYYAIQAKGKHKGEAHTCSTEENMTTCCCICNCVNDVKSRPLDPDNIYQQFEIVAVQGGCRKGFKAQSLASDGFPPQFLRRKGWEIYTGAPKYFILEDAPGLDAALRSRLPDFGFPASCESSEPVVVGRWYCPFMFVKEAGTTLEDQVKRSMYYTMTLEQRWERIYSAQNAIGGGNSVAVKADVRSAVIMIGGREAVCDGKNAADGVIWFRSLEKVGGGEVSLGLLAATVERMKWEEGRFGWNGGEEKEVKVMKVEEYGGVAGWRSFGCYVLVERFVLKRMDASLVLTYDFKHTQHMRSKWE